MRKKQSALWIFESEMLIDFEEYLKKRNSQFSRVNQWHES